MRLLGVVAAMLLLAACAGPVVQQPAQLTPATGKGFRLTLAVEAGYSTTLRANTRWELVGTVAQGEVYRTRDQVVALRGDDIHEAYIVVRQGALVGFYLPVERTFSPETPGKPLTTDP